MMSWKEKGGREKKNEKVRELRKVELKGSEW
jgi:hypothetical protein